MRPQVSRGALYAPPTVLGHWGNNRMPYTLPPCAAQRAKPATVLCDDWFTHHGERVGNANFPVSSELRSNHRLGYSNRKSKHKCSQSGRWSGGAPAQHGTLECTPHGEARLHNGNDYPSQNGTNDTRHPSTKSVKIEGYESTAHHSGDSEAPDTALSSRRPSTEYVSMAAKRVSTGSERTTTMSDKSPRPGPTRLTTTTTIRPQPNLPPRQQAYHFDDEPGIKSSDMERTAHAIVSHETPTRRHTDCLTILSLWTVKCEMLIIWRLQSFIHPPLLYLIWRKGSSLVCRAIPLRGQLRPFWLGRWPVGLLP